MEREATDLYTATTIASHRIPFQRVTRGDPATLLPAMNFARDVVDAAPGDRRALVELSREGGRREWSFDEVAGRAARLAGTLTRAGVGRGDIVMTLIGNRPEWVLAMVACFRLGAVALPCNEQLRAKDLRLRLAVAEPAAIVADERDADELRAAEPACPLHHASTSARIIGRDDC